MMPTHQELKRYILGPDGAPITRADLPKQAAAEWDSDAKKLMVAAVEGGLISLEACCLDHDLTIDDFLAMQRRVRASRK